MKGVSSAAQQALDIVRSYLNLLGLDLHHDTIEMLFYKFAHVLFTSHFSSMTAALNTFIDREFLKI